MKLSFSQRIGIEQVPEDSVPEYLSEKLKNKIWNYLYVTLFSGVEKCSDIRSRSDLGAVNAFRNIWSECLNWRLDEIPYRGYEAVPIIKKFFFTAEWHKILSFLENLNGIDYRLFNNLSYEINKILESEFSAYRLIEGQITEINSPEEREEISLAIKHASYNPVKEHLMSALKLLSDREQPDYRNSIKESISAVEALCQKITCNNKASLGDALKIVEKNHTLHAALQVAFTKLYGYTSDAQGIRHCMSEEKNPTQADARFMLIVCSAFVNYLTDISRN